jgi:hypothetical protein
VKAEPGISRLVEAGLVAAVVRFAVHLYAQSGGSTVEVEQVLPGGMLLAEFQTVGSVTEGEPEAEFGRRKFLTQAAGASDRLSRGS